MNIEQLAEELELLRTALEQELPRFHGNMIELRAQRAAKKAADKAAAAEKTA
jgi:hypothetical protein